MGTWGNSPFDNDVALDWVGDLERIGDTTFLRQSLEIKRLGGYFDSDDGCMALAAGEVVAALLGRPGSGLPYEVRTWVRANPDIDADSLVAPALRAIEEVLSSGSELRELWEDDEELFAQWYKRVQNLVAWLHGNVPS